MSKYFDKYINRPTGVGVDAKYQAELHARIERLEAQLEAANERIKELEEVVESAHRKMHHILADDYDKELLERWISDINEKLDAMKGGE